MNKDKQLLLKYLHSQNLMTLATTSGKTLWTSSVYYVVDESFNLYFLSEPESIHGQQMHKTPKIACAIADSGQKVTDQKIGAQIQGMATWVNTLSKIRWMIALWNKVNPGFETTINLKNIQNKVIKSRVYKIKPSLIKFFNEELYGPEGFKLFEFE